ncbi:MAG: DUF4159 domain-containing protein [Planctomycetota bacterium]
MHRPAAAAATDPFDHRPPRVDVALVIDQSYSMRRNDPERLRVAAAKRFVELAAAGGRIGNVCVVAFDAESKTLLPLTPPSKTTAFRRALGRISALGQTNMDRALERAAAELERGGSAARTVLLLTDGKNDPKQYENTHRAFRGKWPVYTVGLSKEADAKTLKQIARETGGEFFDAPTNKKLREIFSRICFAIERRAIIRTDRLDLAPGRAEHLSVPVDDAITHTVFSARGRQREAELRVEPPGPAEPEDRSASGAFRFAAYRNPPIGRWKATVRAGAQQTRATFKAAATTDLFPVLFPLKDRYNHGQPIHVVCSLARVARAVEDATATAVIRVGGKRYEQTLRSAGGGIYEGAFTGDMPHGPFRLAVSFAGETAKGNVFRRQLTADGRIEPRRQPEIRADIDAIDLGRLYNTETGRASVTVRKLLPPKTKLDLHPRFLGDTIPADAVELRLGPADAKGRQKLILAVTVPARQKAGDHRARLVLALGKARHAIPVRLDVANPRLVAEPRSVVFGRTLVDSATRKQLRLRAEPKGALDLELSLTGGAAKFSSVDRAKLRVGPAGATVTLALAVPAGAEPGERTGVLQIDTGFRRTTVPISLTVVRAALVASPVALDFGEVEPGKTATRTVELGVSSPVAVAAELRAELGGGLAPRSLDLHGKQVRLKPGHRAQEDASLRIPPAQRTGPISGVVRVTARGREIGSIPVRARVVPVHTFVVEPTDARIGPVPIGRERSAPLTIRSTLAAPQTVRIEPDDGSPFVAIEPRRVELGPNDRATVTAVCRPTLESRPGHVGRTFRLSGPMRGRSITASAEIVPPDGGTFRVDRVVRAGAVPPGGTRRAELTVTSTIDVPQDIRIEPDRSLDRPVWVEVGERRVRLGPAETATVTVRCTAFPGAGNARHEQALTVRGPLGERTTTVAVDIRAPAASRPTRTPLLLLFSFALLLLAALVYLILCALFELPMPRMAKYFASAAVLNVAFFVLLTQMLGMKEMAERHYVSIRLDETFDLASEPAVRMAPPEEPVPVKETERPAEPEERRARPEEKEREPLEARSTEPEARTEEQARHEVTAEHEILRRHPELTRMTERELQEVIDAAKKVEQQVEESRPIEPTLSFADTQKARAETERRKRPEEVQERAAMARKLRTERTTRATDAGLIRPRDRPEKLRTEPAEPVGADVREVRRATERAGLPRPGTAAVPERLAPGDEPEGRSKSEAARADLGRARRGSGERPASGGPVARLVARLGPPSRKPVTSRREHIAGEAKPSQRSRVASHVVEAPESGAGMSRSSAGAPGTKGAAAGADRDEPAVRETALRRDLPAGPPVASALLARPPARRKSTRPVAPRVRAETPPMDRIKVAPRPEMRTPARVRTGIPRAESPGAAARRGAARADAAPALDALPAAPRRAAAGTATTLAAKSRTRKAVIRVSLPEFETTRDVAKARHAAPSAVPPEAAAGGERARTSAAGPQRDAVAEGTAAQATAAPADAGRTVSAGREVALVASASGERRKATGPPEAPAAEPGGVRRVEVGFSRPVAGHSEARVLRARGTTGGGRTDVAAAGSEAVGSPAITDAEDRAIRALGGGLARREAGPAHRGQTASPTELTAPAVRPVERGRTEARATAPGASIADARRAGAGSIGAVRGPAASPDEPTGRPSPLDLVRARLGAPVDAVIAGRTRPVRLARLPADEGVSPAVRRIAKKTEDRRRVELAIREAPTTGAPERGAVQPPKRPARAEREGTSAARARRGRMARPLRPRHLAARAPLASARSRPKRAVPRPEHPEIGPQPGPARVAAGPSRVQAEEPVQATHVRRRKQVAHLPRRPATRPAADEAAETPLTRLERAPVRPIRTRPTRRATSRLPGLDLMGRRGGGTVRFALARYSGDWDCDKTAMLNLAFQLQRRVGIMLDTEAKTVGITDPALKEQPFIFLSGHKDFRFTDAERTALREYVRGGGAVWINDSTHELDDTFDRAVRRELKRLFPDQELTKLESKHPVFASAYDLSGGFKGYKVPPGDKYRCDYLEGVRIGGRTPIIYTRNDYGDGLEIDPNTAPLMPSLTDLSPRDMQEGSTRMGINIALYFLRDRLGGRNVGEIARNVREHTAKEERHRQTALATATFTLLDGFDEEFSWALEEGWGDAAEVRRVTAGRSGVMEIRFRLGKQRKIAVSRDLLEQVDLSKQDALVLDVDSRLSAGCRIAVGLITMPDWRYFESPPRYLKPGRNANVVFPLGGATFKSEASGWKYNQRVENLSAVRKVVLLIYPIRGGAVRVDDLRLAAFKKKNPAGGPGE